MFPEHNATPEQRELVLRNIRGVLRVVDQLGEELVEVGNVVDETYSHRNIWYRAVMRANSLRSPRWGMAPDGESQVKVPMKDSNGVELHPFTPEEIEAEWQRWRTVARTEGPLSTAPKSTGTIEHSLLASIRRERQMPEASSLDFVVLKYRGNEVAYVELRDMILAHVGLPPTREAALSWILIFWALRCDEAAAHPVHLTSFQHWKRQLAGKRPPKGSDCYARVSKYNDFGEPHSWSEYIARSTRAESDMQLDHEALAYALDTVGIESRPAISEPLGAGADTPSKRKRRGKSKEGKGPGREWTHGFADLQEACSVARAWNAARAAEPSLTKSVWIARRNDGGATDKLTKRRLDACIRALGKSKKG